MEFFFHGSFILVYNFKKSTHKKTKHSYINCPERNPYTVIEFGHTTFSLSYCYNSNLCPFLLSSSFYFPCLPFPTLLLLPYSLFSPLKYFYCIMYQGLQGLLVSHLLVVRLTRSFRWQKSNHLIVGFLILVSI